MVNRCLSLGGGVQSSTLLLMSEEGIIPKYEYAFFSDTGSEPKETYDYIEMLIDCVSTEIITVSNGDLRKDLFNEREKSVRNPPFFSGNGGMLFRQCTEHYKIIPIQRMIKELYGNAICNLSIGISWTEWRGKRMLINTPPRGDYKDV